MNVTLVPEQIVVAEAATATDGVTLVFTVIVTGEDVAVVGDAQVAVEVITQVTIAPLLNAAFVYVVPPVPTFVPFNFH